VNDVKKARAAIWFAFLSWCLLGCSGGVDSKNSNSVSNRDALTLATTTSTRDSGLLDALIPLFESETGIKVKVIAVGSGQALEMGRRGDADILLTHAPKAEKEFVANGYGTKRTLIMHNDFVIVGPTDGSTNGSVNAINEGSNSAAKAFKEIAASEAKFVSRGDDSGTHRKEMALWQAAELQPEGDWYLEAGAGMAAALRIANEKEAYTLTDRGTFLSQQDLLQLSIVLEGDPLLRNQYAAIPVNAERHSHVNAAASEQFVNFLIKPNTQKTIAEHGVKKFGQPLFFPNPIETKR